MTAYPSIVPTSRSFEAGDWPIKRFASQNGSEVRILYGNRRIGHTLSLGYENINDATAQQFIQHYYEQKGTYQTFSFETTASTIGQGWEGSSDFFNAGAGVKWRYAGPPTIQQVRPGISSVTVNFIAVGVN
jgi:hypothetical protein